MSITAINVRNQFRGKIKEIIEGPVLSEIDVETPARLKLGVGKEVIALVKATEVSLATL